MLSLAQNFTLAQEPAVISPPAWPHFNSVVRSITGRLLAPDGGLPPLNCRLVIKSKAAKQQLRLSRMRILELIWRRVLSATVAFLGERALIYLHDDEVTELAWWLNVMLYAKRTPLRFPHIPESCIYFLMRAGEVVYIGQTTQCWTRIGTHIEVARRNPARQFDDVQYVDVPIALLDAAEDRFIVSIRPPLNQRGLGRFAHLR